MTFASKNGILLKIKGVEIMPRYKDFAFSESGSMGKIDEIISNIALYKGFQDVEHLMLSFEDFVEQNSNKLFSEDKVRGNATWDDFQKEMAYRIRMSEHFQKKEVEDTEKLRTEMENIPEKDLNNFLAARKMHFCEEKENDDFFYDSYFQEQATIKAQEIALSVDRDKERKNEI